MLPVIMSGTMCPEDGGFHLMFEISLCMRSLTLEYLAAFSPLNFRGNTSRLKRNRYHD